MREIADIIIDAIARGNKIMVCGCGGSASQSQHFAGELVNKFFLTRRPLPMISLASDIAVITSIANDFGFIYVFSKQIQAIGNSGDVLITLSTSGKSNCILHAADVARSMGIKVVPFPTNSDLNWTTPQTQERHLQMIHRISEIVEDHFK